MPKSSSQQDWAVAPMDELDAVADANRSTNQIELIMRLRAAAEICEALDTETLFGLARRCSEQSAVVVAFVKSV